MDSLIWAGRFVLDRLCAQEVRSAWLHAAAGPAASAELPQLGARGLAAPGGLLLLPPALGCPMSAARGTAKRAAGGLKKEGQLQDKVGCETPCP